MPSVGEGAASGAAAGTSVMPGWGTVIGGVIGAAAAYFGGKSSAAAAAKLTGPQKELFNLILANTKTASDFGKFMVNLSRDPMISSTNWMNSIASGDRESIMAMPGVREQLNGVSEGARQSIQTMQQLAPRSSGAGADFMSRLPTDTAVKQSQIIGGTQNEARVGQANAALGLAGGGLSALGQGAGNGENLLGFTQNQRQYAQQVGEQTGGSIYSVFQNILGSNNSNGTRNPGAVDFVSNWWKNRGSGQQPVGGSGGSTVPGWLTGSNTAKSFFGGN